MLSCDRLDINIDHCSANFSPSRVSCQPAAFVLHGINNYTTESYLNFTKERFLRGKDYFTDYPKSVHFLIGSNGIVYQLVELTDRAWGVAELKSPSWPLLNQCSWSDHEDMLIHIGFIGSTPDQKQTDVTAEIICCIAIREAGINISPNEFGIIVARDLNINLDCLWSVPDSLIPKAQVCIQQGGKDPFYLDDIGTYGSRIQTLEQQLAMYEDRVINVEVLSKLNNAAINEINTQLAELQTEVQSINIQSIEQRLTDLEAGNLEVWKAVRIIQECLDCNNLCTPVTPTAIHYRLDSSTPSKLTPGVILHINLPIRVSDTRPPIVTTGPLWFAELLADIQSLCTTVKVKISARLSTAMWCAGRTLEGYVIVNSQNILVDTYEASAGSQSVFIYGETLVTLPPDALIYMGLKTDEDTEPLEIVEASIIIECADGVFSPNCLDCDTT